jgi:serine/threonine protein kinase
MEDEDREQSSVKFFRGIWHRAEDMASLAFSREFDACRRLSHPCIVPVHVFAGATKGTEAGLITRYTENRSHTDVLGRVTAGNLPSFWTPTWTGIIVVGIACGLRFIHWKGFVHRDLKPSNS